ncbi:MAG: SCO family protein [Bacteroidetes bacterium]|nr:SCO family protein [Bacteroidota bacterium]
MKKIILTLSFSTLLMFSCKEKEEKDCCKKDKSNTEDISKSVLFNESIHNLESRWVKQNKDSMSLGNLSNKITVAAMVFTHCESACPRIVADIQRIEKSFTPEELKNIQFLLISMDPLRDTPERFIEFSKEYQLNDDWICISSDENATMEIANVLNVRIKPLAGGGFDHSNVIHLIDKKGNIIFQQNGLAQEPAEMVKEIRELIRE